MQSTPASAPVSVSPGSLAAAFAAVPDPRRAASVIYPLPAILGLAVAAILANHLSVLAIAEWGTRHDASMLTALDFPPTGPRVSRRSSGCFGNSMVRLWPPP